MNELDVEMTAALLHTPIRRDLLVTDTSFETWGLLGDDVFCHPYGYLMPTAFGAVVCPTQVHFVWASSRLGEMGDYVSGVRLLLEEISITVGSPQQRYVTGVQSLREISPSLAKLVMEVQSAHG